MTVMVVCGYVICALLGLLAATILWLIWTDRIKLDQLLSEANGTASMSRFQLLIFTFVIAASLFIAMLAPLYPAVQAARLDPVTAIRYE